jgi:WD40 repeat protein
VETPVRVEKYRTLSMDDDNIVNTDISPLLAHPDRQRSRKLLESCLREINYLMSQPQPPAPQPQPDEREPRPNNIHLRDSPPADPPPVLNTPPPQDEPRKPRNKDSDQWPFPSPPPEDPSPPATVLERPPPPARQPLNLVPFDHPRSFLPIHTLRSHISPVRSLIACNSASALPDETCFVSGGDDSTVKFWRVSRHGGPQGQGKRKGAFEILPQITFRGHGGIVTCLAEAAGNIFSGGSDGGIRVWKVPSVNRDAYGSSGTPHLWKTELTLGSGYPCEYGVGWTYELYLESCDPGNPTTLTGIRVRG